ncbi:MAG: hypothetical protein HZA36_00855 [Parcubacteria group bacterium]|nr:hypothetical protein [Parcubacteria group bacterium]
MRFFLFDKVPLRQAQGILYSFCHPEYNDGSSDLRTSGTRGILRLMLQDDEGEAWYGHDKK